MSASFLDKLLYDFVEWSQNITDCRAIVLFGSTARGDGDKYSDRDIQVIATDLNNEQYINWMRQYAPLWTLLREHNVSEPLWAIMYRGGHKVHLSVNSVDNLQRMIDSGQLSMDYQRGYQILLDKDNLAVRLPPPQSPIYTPPTQEEFTECVQNFVYGTALIAKHLKRGNLWTVQWANGIERGFLLQMIEWHARTLNPDGDTWHRGEQMRAWVNPATWQALQGVVGRFDAADSWQALFAMIDLFRTLAQETAVHRNYLYPDTMVSEVVAYLEGLHTS